MRTQIICDVLVRFKRVQGVSVLHLAGWDLFEPLESLDSFYGDEHLLSGQEEETRSSILQTKTALRVLNGSPRKQGRLRDWDKDSSVDTVRITKYTVDTAVVVIDPRALPTTTWQETSKIEDRLAIRGG